MKPYTQSEQEAARDQDESAASGMYYMIEGLKARKPNDRSDRDRSYAVTITELERAYAYFVVYVVAPPGGRAEEHGEDDNSAPPSIDSLIVSLRELVAVLRDSPPEGIDPGVTVAAIAAFERSLSRLDASE